MIADGKNTYIMAGINSDIVECWQECYDRFKDQTADLVKVIAPYGSVDNRCQAIFGYMVNNTTYVLDPDGEQLIKSPARFLEDGYGDCKSYTMFIASCLHCARIKCKVRFVNYDGSNQYTHVYPVAIDEMGREIPMDACERDPDGTALYNYCRPYITKKEFIYN